MASFKTGLESPPKVKIGKAVPKFKLEATGGQTVAETQFKKKITVVFFYPKDMTPGCTTEAHDFTRLKTKFARFNTQIFGVSRDSIKSHEKFVDKESYKIDLISDPDEKLCKIFGVMKLKNMYGKQVRGIDRSTFIIDESGKLLKEWRGVKVPGHAEEVLEYIKSL